MMSQISSHQKDSIYIYIYFKEAIFSEAKSGNQSEDSLFITCKSL